MTQQHPSGPDRAAQADCSVKSFLDGLPTRSGHDRILGGVCGGLAREWGRSPWLVRLAVIALGVLPGPMWVVYALAWMAMPLEPLHSGAAYGAPAHGEPACGGPLDGQTGATGTTGQG